MRVIKAHDDRARHEGDDRLQPDRRDRRDAPPPRPSSLAQGGTCVMASLNRVGLTGMIALPPRLRSCRSTPIATAGATSAAIRSWAGPTSPGRSSGAWPVPTTCMSTASPTSSARRRQRHSLGPSLPHAAVAGEALHRDAGLLLGPDRAAGRRDLRRARIGRPHLCGRRRHHGPSGRHRGGVAGIAGGLGGRRWPAFRWQSTRRRIRRWPPALDARRDDRASAARGPLVAFYGDDFTGSSARWRC